MKLETLLLGKSFLKCCQRFFGERAGFKNQFIVIEEFESMGDSLLCQRFVNWGEQDMC